MTFKSKGVLILIWVSMLLTGCLPAGSTPEAPGFSVPDGWYLSLHNTRIHLTNAREEGTAWRFYFDRSGDETSDAYYIRIAEAVFPDRNRVIAAASRDPKTEPLKDSWYFERLWWFEVYDHCRIPFSITADTLYYYLERYRSTQSDIQRRQTASDWKGAVPKRIQFHYRAQVLKTKSDTAPPAEDGMENRPDGYSVKVLMKMKWYEFEGQTGGWGFEKERQVLFAGPKNIIAVRGDGPTRKWVSSPDSPYLPDQWVTF